MTVQHFSEYLRILGKGPKTKRSLTSAEASDVLDWIWQGNVTNRQLGALLLLMRANGETADELVGFVQGLKRCIVSQQSFDATGRSDVVDVDWPTYAGKWRYPPYYLMAIKLLSRMGLRVLMHGNSGQFDHRQYADAFLHGLAIPTANDLSEAHSLLQTAKEQRQGAVVYIDMTSYAPALVDILHLRDELGVRTVFNTLAKVHNPLNAMFSVQGIFHKGLEQLHHRVNAWQATTMGCQTRVLVFKGEGGEAEIRPDARSLIHLSQADVTANKAQLIDHVLPAQIKRQEKPDAWDVDSFLAMWHSLQSEQTDVYGEQAVLSTAAVVWSHYAGMNWDQAWLEVKQYWQQR